MENGYIVSVSQANEYVNGLLQQDALLRNLGIRGEISGFKRHSSGHLYFSLKDEGALIRCVMFRQHAMNCSFFPADGMQVTAFGSISLYVRDGQYQFYVRSMEQQGEGELYRRFMMQKTRLQAKGYFSAEHKKPLPYLPRRVGVVTSETGAVFQDIRNVIKRRFPQMDIVLCPARVQGEGAAREIAGAIHALDASGLVDVMIVGRGGGGIEDLWAFNEEIVADAIYRCNTPIVSAVGHETDFTIADFTADLRAPTPSAAAELCVPERVALEEQLQRLNTQMERSTHQRIAECRAALHSIIASHAMAKPEHLLAVSRQRLDLAQTRLQEETAQTMQSARERLARMDSTLRALSPYSVLKRGYAIARNAQGQSIASISNLREGQSAELIFYDGNAEITIDKINLREGK